MSELFMIGIFKWWDDLMVRVFTSFKWICLGKNWGKIQEFGMMDGSQNNLYINNITANLINKLLYSLISIYVLILRIKLQNYFRTHLIVSRNFLRSYISSGIRLRIFFRPTAFLLSLSNSTSRRLTRNSTT